MTKSAFIRLKKGKARATSKILWGHKLLCRTLTRYITSDMSRQTKANRIIDVGIYDSIWVSVIRV